MKDERRKTTRRKILESFSVFVSIPKKGGYRLPVHDMSEGGISFDLDTDGEDLDHFPAQSGEKLEVHVYINQSVFVPLQVKMIRVSQPGSSRGQVREIGAEILTEPSKGYPAYCAFLKLVDHLYSLA